MQQTETVTLGQNVLKHLVLVTFGYQNITNGVQENPTTPVHLVSMQISGK